MSATDSSEDEQEWYYEEESSSVDSTAASWSVFAPCIPDHHTAGRRPTPASTAVAATAQRLVVVPIMLMETIDATRQHMVASLGRNRPHSDITRMRASLSSRFVVEHLQTPSPSFALRSPTRFLGMGYLSCHEEVEQEKKLQVGHTGMWHTGREVRVGDEVDVEDTVHKWCSASVVGTNVEDKLVQVHYLGWSMKWDERLPMSSPRIRPSGTNTDFCDEDGNWHLLVRVLEPAGDMDMQAYGPASESVSKTTLLMKGLELRPPFAVRARRGQMSWSALLQVVFDRMRLFMVGGPRSFQDAVAVWESLPFSVEITTEQTVACPLCGDLAYHRHRVLPSDELAWYSASMRTVVVWHDMSRYKWDPAPDWRDFILSEAVPLPAIYQNGFQYSKLVRWEDSRGVLEF